MIEIKNIIFTKCKMNFFKEFICFINHVIPLRLKFTNESFVALVDKKPNALITLDKDSKSFTRLKITKLILEENSTDIACQLVSYVISRYRAMGASSFYVNVDEKQADLLNIFQNELNFRACGFEYLYKINSVTTSATLYLKPFKKDQTKDVCDFYNENINSFNRFLFARQNYQFKNGCQQFVFSEENDKILAYFEIATKNNVDFYINFAIDFGYNIYLMDAIKIIFTKIKQKNKNANLYIKVKDYFMNSKELINILNENNIELVSKSRILAKDYYKAIKEDNILKNAKIVFSDPTIA